MTNGQFASVANLRFFFFWLCVSPVSVCPSVSELEVVGLSSSIKLNKIQRVFLFLERFYVVPIPSRHREVEAHVLLMSAVAPYSPLPIVIVVIIINAGPFPIPFNVSRQFRPRSFLPSSFLVNSFVVNI